MDGHLHFVNTYPSPKMKIFSLITVTLLIGVVSSAPTENNLLTSFGKSETLPEKYVIYRGEYDIANILLPINSLNNKNENKESNEKPYIFFALADFTKGHKEDKGFYIRKNGEVTKLLDHGRDAATAMDGISEVYIAAEDGIYTYNPKNNTAEKYGIVTDDLIGIAKVNGSDIIYILTKDHVVYQVTDQGMKIDKVEDIVNPEQIVLDYENNLYYVKNNNVNVFSPNGTKKIEGLPETMTYVKLIRPPLPLTNGVPVVVDHTVYIVFANGTSKLTNLNATLRPTAYSLEGTVLLYLGHDKKIYEYNILALILDSMFSKFKEYLDGVVKGIEESFRIFR
ncbi:unnamed protein product [Arctia plantaginis]|uniref:Uncharacterized protein n=1 Tax=Arctia plantaginis TaxID=874455 RepID=A0A8S0ZIC6_ARCPL|nr:unnamed protein product [Arctia plantaginis]